MLKICGPSICKPLEILFKSCLESRIFPLEWKKESVVVVHLKETTGHSHFFRYVEKYFNVLYNEVFDFLITNHLISTNQSGFKPG